MSVKAMSLVWEISCPSKVNGKDFKPGHKFVLLAYADHADQGGRNVYPAIPTVARKTGYDDRSIQRLTRELEEMGLLVADGSGPKGSNRWFIPFSSGGDKISPLAKLRGDAPSGDIPSGDIPSGDKMSPELKNNPENDISNKSIEVWDRVKSVLKSELPRASFETWVDTVEVGPYDVRTLILVAKNGYAAEWLEERLAERIQELSGMFVKIIVNLEAELNADSAG